MILEVAEAWHINTRYYAKAAQKVLENFDNLDQLFKIKKGLF